MPFRAPTAAAAISSSSRKEADHTSVAPHSSAGGGGLAKRPRREVLLPSQEGTKGVVQYALYVAAALLSPRSDISRSDKLSALVLS